MDNDETQEVEAVKKPDIENYIIEMVVGLIPEVDGQMLSDWLVALDWAMIGSDEWCPGASDERKAQLLAKSAKATLRKVGRTVPKAK